MTLNIQEIDYFQLEIPLSLVFQIIIIRKFLNLWEK